MNINDKFRINKYIREALALEDASHLAAASFRNFHAKGFDYLCLRRTPELTVKLYVLQGDASKISEVVNPHDHRYAFRTTVVYGAMLDHRFIRNGAYGKLYNAFDYSTPLNGGGGFVFRGKERLLKCESKLLTSGKKLMTAPDDLHTIQMISDKTILLLEQYADVVPVGVPTSTWVKKKEPKFDTSGLYEKINEGQYRDAVRAICKMIA
jgi:hypothetical protein